MLLIDADNVSLDLIEQAVGQLLAEYGALHVRRAYCTAESALKHQAAFKRLGVRPMVNLAAGKNSTDIALAVDALDLVLAERPDVVVIASSDSDFAPLVARLREKGCRVRGIGQQGKTGAETQQIYDDFVVLTHRGEAAEASTGKPRNVRSARARRTPHDAQTSAVAPETQAAPARRPLRARGAHKAAPPRAEMPDTVRSVLAALPELHRGQTVELRVAAERLRDAALLGARASSTKFFAPLAEHFELLPVEQPNKLRWRGA
jgi:uncharacterized protein (TIGR00288 family)